MSTKTPNPLSRLCDGFYRWAYIRYGTKGIVVQYGLVALLLGGCSLWAGWVEFHYRPGVAALIEFSRTLPHADPAGFSVAVANLAEDEKGNYKTVILDSLKEFEPIEVLAVNRTIRSEGPAPQQAVIQGHELARQWLKKSGADALVWGRVLHSDVTMPKLYWTVRADPGSKPIVNSYPVVSSSLGLPELFQDELSQVLKLLAVQHYVQFSQRDGPTETDLMGPFLVKVEEIFSRVPLNAKPAMRATFARILGDAKASHAIQRGDNAELLQAIAYYRTAVGLIVREDQPDAWRGTRVNLAIALKNIGEHERDAEKLQEALALQREALRATSPKEAPADWALIEYHLGNGLVALGVRESGTEQFVEALAAYEAALSGFPRERSPLDWACVQYRRGVALTALGERESDNVHLEQAVGSFRSALEIRTRERSPIDWAVTQVALCAALGSLGERTNDPKVLQDALASLRSALPLISRERSPFDWANAQNHLGESLKLLGDREDGIARLTEAAAAYREALKEYTRERSPLDWARVENNLGVALTAMGVRENNLDRFREAADLHRESLEEWTRARAPLFWATAQANLGDALKAWDDRANNAARLTEAAGAYRAALTEFSQERTPREWAKATSALDAVQSTLATRETTRPVLTTP